MASPLSSTVEARALVEDLLYEYCEAMDAADKDRVVAVFTSDCVLELDGQPPVRGHAALDAHVVGELRRVRATSHHCSNVRVEMADDGNAARVSSYLMVWSTDAHGRQERRFVRCVDDVVRSRHAWGIRHRRHTDVTRTAEGTDQAAAVFEVMATNRAVRRFRDEPVPDELLRRVVEAATWAPSPQNRQPWEFLVLTSADALGVVAKAIGSRADELDDLAGQTSNPDRQKMFSDVADLVRGIGSVPAVILVCGHPLGYASPAGSDAVLLSALHAASQNLLLGARSLGLGGVFTTLHAHGEAAIRDGLGIPSGLLIAGMIVLGWPAVAFGQVRRRPVDEVLHWQRWRDEDQQCTRE